MAHIHPAPSPHQSDTAYTVSNTLTRLAVGGAIAGAAIMLAPHILPAMGIGSAALAEESMWVLHTGAEAGGTGLAGAISGALGSVPVIGPQLAAGGLFNAAATGIIGVGGVLLGNYIEKREDGSKRFRWGKALKYGALITSAIIALPTILTAIGSGLVYLSTLVGSASFTSSVVGFISSTIGTMGGAGHAMMGFSGIAAVIPHILTCGVSVLPAALAYTLPDQPLKPAEKYTDGTVSVRMEVNKPIEANVPCTARLRLTHRITGQPITADELAIVHTEKLHLFVVDTSLKDYHHVHPQPTEEPGVFSFSFTPGKTNSYSAWADFTLLRDHRNHRIKTEIASASGRNMMPHSRANTQADLDGLHFEWQSEPLQQGAPAIVRVNITDASGKVVNDLQPVMGAFAHLVGFSADGSSLIHTHPLGNEPQHPDGRGSGQLRFHIEPDYAGDTQFYLQIRRNEQDSYIPIGQRIRAPGLVTERLASSHASRAPSYGYAG